MVVRSIMAAALLAACAGCRSGGVKPAAGALPETVSLLGEPLAAPPIPDDRRSKLEDDLARARAAHDAMPGNEENAIWYGRRLAYLGRYRESIAVFTKGLQTNPQSYRLRRHRGHRYITIREFDSAIADLSEAARLIDGVPDEVEPDGAPNARNIPRSTSHSNIWYHLGLAHYLKGDFGRAAEAYRRCLEFSRVNDDMLVATTYWLYLSLRRAGQEGAPVLAPIRPDMDVIENDAYLRLLLMFKGQTALGGEELDDPAVGYGFGAWQLLTGDARGARKTFERVVKGPNWPAFGYIAAEAELARAR